MARIFDWRDAPAAGLAGRRVVLVGYGNQGRAHAANLRDEGLAPLIGARPDGRAWNSAREAGFEVLAPAAAAALADVLLLLTPDETQAQLYADEIRPQLRRGAALGFAHGFAVGFGLLDPGPGIDVFLVAPKAQGRMVRRLYAAGRGAAALVAVHQDATGGAWQTALAYAAALGCLRTGALATSFREEAVSDLFGEQAVLCGGLGELVRAAFETLVARGYAPEIAYFECLHEVKILADLLYAKGIDGMRGPHQRHRPLRRPHARQARDRRRAARAPGDRAGRDRVRRLRARVGRRGRRGRPAPACPARRRCRAPHRGGRAARARP